MKKRDEKHEELKWKVRHWSDQIGVKVGKINVRKMKRKWASVSTAGYLTLNSEVAFLPDNLSEFVIVHEIIHLLAPNHSKLFKSYMHTYLPDWEDRDKKLKEHSDNNITNK